MGKALVKSFRAYAADLGYWGLLMIVPLVLDAIGIYQIATGDQFTNASSVWWFVAGTILLILIPFIAYHRMREQLLKISEDRARELARLILETRDKAAKVVTRYKIEGYSTEDLTKDIEAYQAAFDKLGREAEIDGGVVKEAIFSGFSTFVAFHLTRFVAWDGKVLSGETTKQQLEIDELQFVGRMASRADKTIEEIRKLTR